MTKEVADQMNKTDAEQAVPPEVVPAVTVLFGGRMFKLGSGVSVPVTPWGVKVLTREIPQIFGRIAGRLTLVKGAVDASSVVGVIIGAGMEDVLDLLAVTCKVDKEQVLLADGVMAEDIIRLLTATVEVNKSFFEALSDLRAVFNRELNLDKKPDGTPSPQS